jgi:hypothetical protein
MAKKTKAPPIEGETAAEKQAARSGAAAPKAAPKKSAAKKAVAKKTVARPKAAAKKAALAETPPARPKAAPRTISVAERHARIAEAAFLRAESLGFAGTPHDHWAHAEAEVDARLRKSRVKLVD